jgi:pyruvate dehydrogenase phosphatase
VTGDHNVLADARRAAIGDHAFKMPRTVVERVFLNADPPMKTNAERVENWVPRILTPPYLTHTAAIQHRKLAREHDRFLVLASDGLTDVLSSDSPLLTDAHIQGVAQAMGQAEEGAPLASQLLKYAMGGSDMAKTSQYLTVDMEGKAWMDDTTVVCLKL